MENVVVVIDSGINKELFKNKIVGGKRFILNDGAVLNDEFYEDDNGHGTACACIISSAFPNAKFYVVKILDSHAETDFPVLMTALEHCLTLKYSLINLSLSILSPDKNNELERICILLKQSGKVIMTSVFNGHKRSYPAIYNSVIGIRGSRFKHRDCFWFNPHEQIQCIADVTPQLTDRLMDKYFLFGGNSKACATMAGLVMNYSYIENVKIEFEMVCQLLMTFANRTTWKEKDIDTSLSVICEIDNSLDEECSLENEIEQLIREIKSDQLYVELDWDKSLFETGLIHPSNCKELVENLENHFGIEIPSKLIDFNYLGTISMIARMIEGAMNEKD